jgi:hypothetical protein
MLQWDLNEKCNETDLQTVKASVKKAGEDANIDSSIEISNIFDSPINEGDGESNDHEISNETKTKEKLNHQQKDSGKKQKRGSDDKTAHLNEKAKQSQNNGRDSTNNKKKQKVKKNGQKEEACELGEGIATERQHNNKTVVVAGDSIIKYVKGWKLSNAERKVSVKSFSGATVNDMSDFLKPTVRKQPKKLIIHAGTNNLRHSSPNEIADKVIELAENFQKDCSHTEVIISSLVIRSDREELARKVNETNNILKSSCLEKKLGFLDNGNISRSHLNIRGLHLNREGNALLQANILHFLSSNN